LENKSDDGFRSQFVGPNEIVYFAAKYGLESDMKKELLPKRVRCYAHQSNGQWQAFSVDFGLAVQGDTFPEVRSKLNNMINDYVHEAVGIDRGHMHELLTRRAPLSVTVGYYVACVVGKVRSFFMNPQPSARRSTNREGMDRLWTSCPNI
jgi:hypothetical protein